MSYFLSKLLPIFVYPLGFAIILCFLGLLLGMAGRKHWAALSILSAIMILWVSSTSVFADFLLNSLERKYPAVTVEDLPGADAIVILGGMTRGIVPGTSISDLSGSVDRLFFGAKLYKANKAPVVIISGGGAQGFVSEAEMMAGFVEALGVPLKDILLEQKSRNTYQNGVNTLLILKEQNLDRVLLVTSASHMKRAIAVFHSLGVSVIPAVTDFQVVEKESLLIDWLPTADALRMTTGAIKEYVGWLYYSLRGWV